MPELISISDFIGQLSLGLDAVEGSLLGAEPLHSKRVAALCLAMGRFLGYPTERLFSLAACALLHDNALTEYILSEQPGEGRELSLKTHCILGERNACVVPFPYPADGFILYHHECPDGSGPFGLAEGGFPEEAGLIALADQCDVRFHLRRPEPGKREAVRAHIRSLSGTRFTRPAVGAALAVLDGPLLESLADGRVQAVLDEGFPQVRRALSDDELIRISGLTARIIDYKSAFTQVHTTQIANKAWYMGGVYGYDRIRRAELYEAAALHDIGKLFIPTHILEKPGKLTAEEFRVIQSHVRYTWEVLSRVEGFGRIAVWAADHHEKLDGSGYPFGKKAGELDFNSRLLACLDIYQAVREERPYHRPRTHEQAMDILSGLAGRGLLDGGISADLDRHLRLLDGGFAPCPPQLLQDPAAIC